MVGFILLGLWALVTVCLLIPCSIRLHYQTGETAEAVLCWAFFKLRLGGPQKPEKKPVKAKKARKKPPDKKKKSLGEQFGGIPGMAGLLSDLLSAAAEGTGFLARHFPLRVRLQMVVAEGDAAETGIRYGRTNAVVYGILASAHHFLRLKKQEISIQPDFTASQDSVEFSLHGRMLPLFALLGTGNIAGRFLAKTLKRNRRTRAAKAAGSSADHKDGGISMNNEHPINGLLDSSMQNLRSLVDANTVIGEAITTPDGTVIIPVSKVSFGFGSGGSDLPTQKEGELFGGGAGGGVSVQPLAFLVVKDGDVRLLQFDNSKNVADRAVSLMPELFDKVSELFSKKDKNPPDSAGQEGKPQ